MLNIDVYQVKEMTEQGLYASAMARREGALGWSDYVAAKPGERVEMQVELQNISGERLRNATAIVCVPRGGRYVPGTTRLWNSRRNGRRIDRGEALIESGVKLGDYEPDEQLFFQFTVELTGEELPWTDGMLSIAVGVRCSRGEEVWITFDVEVEE